MNEDNINELNKKIESLSKRCDQLENLNKEHKESIQLNKNNIHNLLMQLKILRKEYKKELNDLKIYFMNKFQYLFQIISKNKNITKEIDDDNNINNNDLIYIKNIDEKINNIIEKKLESIRYDIYTYVGNISNSASKKIKIDKNENILYNFENKIFNIFFDSNQKIPEEDIKELKKLGATLLVQHNVSPLDASKALIDKNIEIIRKENNEFEKINFEIKKGVILSELGDVSMRKINTTNEDEFTREFKEKYGISENEINDKELKNEMKKNNYEEEKIIEVILKKLKYWK